MMFRLRLFGRFKAFDGAGEEIRFESQSSACIVALLFLRKGRTATRQELAETIWPDSDQPQQRANLRKALSRLPSEFREGGALHIGPDDVSLDYSAFSSDLVEAEQLHREYLQNRDADGAPAKLEEFWNVIRVPMLVGWDQPTFEALRTRYEFWADEIGSELAELHEDRGELEMASEVWRKILADNPSRLEAIKGLMRCESALHGGEHAQAVVHEILPSLPDSALRDEIQRLFDSQKQHSAVVPPGELLRKRGPILLLVNLFERNLQRGGQESLQLLAAEVESEFAIQHPKVFLSLIDTSLTHSSGWDDARRKLMLSALRLASRSCEFDIGHFWADEAIKDGPSDDIFVPSAMTMKAFLYFEQREYAKAERWFDEAGRHPLMQTAHPTRSFYRAALGGLLWQQARFDEAIALYREEAAFGSSLGSVEGNGIRSRALTNLAYIAGARHRWDECVELGEEAVSLVGLQGLNSMVLLAPLGSAKIHVGRFDDGVEDIKRGLNAMGEAGMKRYNQIALDYVSTSVAKRRGREVAQQFADANSAHRQALHHYRSPAEVELLQRSGLADQRVGPTEFSRQSPRTLNKLLVESLL